MLHRSFGRNSVRGTGAESEVSEATLAGGVVILWFALVCGMLTAVMLPRVMS